MPEDPTYDVFDIYDDQGSPDPQQPTEQREDYLVRVRRGQIKDVASKAKAHDEAMAEATAAKRELAFMRAGIDLAAKDEKTRFFADHYDGELTAEAIKAKAEAFGVMEAQPAPNSAEGEAAANEAAGLTPGGDTRLEAGEAAQNRESAALRQGSQPDQPVPADPVSEAESVHRTALQQGAQEKVALGGAFNTLVNAAAQGDSRVIVPSPRQPAQPPAQPSPES